VAQVGPLWVPNGGRTWWAHFEFTRINIEPIILHKKIEEQLIVGRVLPPSTELPKRSPTISASRIAL